LAILGMVLFAWQSFTKQPQSRTRHLYLLTGAVYAVIRDTPTVQTLQTLIKLPAEYFACLLRR
jgi:hypothetical protein